MCFNLYFLHVHVQSSRGFWNCYIKSKTITRMQENLIVDETPCLILAPQAQGHWQGVPYFSTLKAATIHPAETTLNYRNLLFSYFSFPPQKKTAPILVLPPLSPSQDILSNPQLPLPSQACKLLICTSVFPFFSLSPSIFLSHSAFSAVTLITMRSKRWHSLLQHYSGRIQQTLGLMECPHHAAPWFITYFCHNALADNSYSTPFTATTYVSHAERGTVGLSVCLCLWGMTSHDVRIWAQRMVIWEATLCTWLGSFQI